MLEKFKRWLKFNVVGGGGVILQLCLLALLTKVFEFHYLLATLLAVEGAVLHNFVWHELWTWKDKRCETRRDLISRLLRFHLSNGVTSIVGNLVLMKLAVGQFHIPVLIANLLAISACSVINFVLSDLFVFRQEDTETRGPQNSQPLHPCRVTARTGNETGTHW